MDEVGIQICCFICHSLPRRHDAFVCTLEDKCYIRLLVVFIILPGQTLKSEHIGVESRIVRPTGWSLVVLMLSNLNQNKIHVKWNWEAKLLVPQTEQILFEFQINFVYAFASGGGGSVVVFPFNLSCLLIVVLGMSNFIICLLHASDSWGHKILVRKIFAFNDITKWRQVSPSNGK